MRHYTLFTTRAREETLEMHRFAEKQGNIYPARHYNSATLVAPYLFDAIGGGLYPRNSHFQCKSLLI